MDAQPEAWIIARFALLLIGLLLPGATLMRALRVPATTTWRSLPAVSRRVPSSREKLAQLNGIPLLSELCFGAHAYCAENSMPDNVAPASAALR